MRVGRWVWIGAGLLLAYVAVYTVFVALPDIPAQAPILDLMAIGTALAAASLCGLAALKARDRFMRWFWGLFALANLCSMVAEGLWAVHGLSPGTRAPSPSFADLAWLLHYPLAFAGLMRLVATSGKRRVAETVAWLDAVLVILAGVALSWLFVIAPMIDPTLDSLHNLTIVAYPIGDLLLLGALVSLALRAKREEIPRGTAWIVASFAVMFVADTAYMRMMVSQTYTTGAWIDPLWILSYALFCMGALLYVDGRDRGRLVAPSDRTPLYHKMPGTSGVVHRIVPFGVILLVGLLAVYHFVARGGGNLLQDAVMATLTFLVPLFVLTRQLVVELENTRLQASLIHASQALEQRVAERTRELASEKERLDVLNQAAREISHAGSIPDVLRVGATLLARATHCASVGVSAPGQRGGLRFASTNDMTEAGRQQLRGVLRKYLLSNADNSDSTPLLLDSPVIPSSGPVPAGPFMRTVVFPIISHQTMLGAAGLASDHADCRLSQNELESVANIVSQLAVALESACRYDDARFYADNDALTGLANRRVVTERLEQEIARSARAGSSFSLVVMDVDNFKFFNDTYGHVTGDRVLVATAGALQEAVRAGDVVGRFGGDEFVAILPGTDRTGAIQAMERIGTRLAAHSEVVDGTRLDLRVSCGVAVYPRDGAGPNELFRVADASMYRAKRSGGNGGSDYARHCTLVAEDGQ